MIRRTIALLLLATILGTAPAAGLECGDFPLGVRINSPIVGHQSDIGLAIGSGSTLHAVWTDRRNPAAPLVFYARSEDRGRTFGPGAEVAPGLDLRIAGFPVVASGPGNTVVVVWAGEDEDDLDVWLARSLDGGLTFLPPITVNDRDLGDESLPAVAITPGGITYVGWVEHPVGGESNVRLARALPGQPFGPSVQVNKGTVATSCECCTIDLAILGEEQVAVAFMANLNYVRDIFVSRSANGGITFAEPVQISAGHWFEAACPTSGPRLRLAPDHTLHAVWLDRHDFANQAGIYYSRSIDGGATFLPPLQVNEQGSAVTGHPSFALTADGTIHVLWERYNTHTSAVNLDYSCSTDGGDNFSKACSIGGGTEIFQWLPSVVAWPDFGLAIGWHDDRKGDSDIFVATIGVTTAVEAAAPPPAATQLWASPNPFTGRVRIGFAGGLPVAPGAFTISDVHGRRVRFIPLVGPELEWDGQDDRGQKVPAGSYFLHAPGGGSALKIVRLP